MRQLACEQVAMSSPNALQKQSPDIMTRTTMKQVQCIQLIITSTNPPGTPVRLVTQGCHLMPSSPALPSATAAALGMSQMALVRVALAESPGFRWGSLDTSPQEPLHMQPSASTRASHTDKQTQAAAAAAASAQLAQILASNDHTIALAECKVAENISIPEAVYGQLLAGGMRVLPRMVLQEHPVTAQEGAHDPEGIHDASAGEITAGNTIITGGLGAVGSLIANWLAFQVCKCICIYIYACMRLLISNGDWNPRKTSGKHLAPFEKHCRCASDSVACNRLPACISHHHHA